MSLPWWMMHKSFSSMEHLFFLNLTMSSMTVYIYIMSFTGLHREFFVVFACCLWFLQTPLLAKVAGLCSRNHFLRTLHHSCSRGNNAYSFFEFPSHRQMIKSTKRGNLELQLFINSWHSLLWCYCRSFTAPALVAPTAARLSMPVDLCLPSSRTSWL